MPPIKSNCIDIKYILLQCKIHIQKYYILVERVAFFFLRYQLIFLQEGVFQPLERGKGANYIIHPRLSAGMDYLLLFSLMKSRE